MYTTLVLSLLSELDTDGRDVLHKSFERPEEDLDVIINLKRDAERPLLDKLSSSEETSETDEEPGKNGTNDGDKAYTNFYDTYDTKSISSTEGEQRE